jgi:ABC-type nitrate/sulfonate/bicarbonate transport system substrate-binding protein
MRLATRGRVLAMSAFTIAAALIVAACAGGPAASPSTPASATASSSTETGAATFSPALLGKPETTRVKIASATIKANNMLSQFAIDADLFQKYGLTAEVVIFDGAQRALQAVIAGQVDMLTETPNVTLTSLTTDTPLQNVASFTNKFLDCILTKANITDSATLKGKKVAISSRGGLSHAEVLITLKQFGLTERDVQLTEMGGEGARVAALRAGSVDAIPVECATAARLVEQQGFRVLLRLPEIDTPWAGPGLQVRRSFIDKNPNTTLAVVAVHLEAMQRLFSDEPAAVKSLAAWAQMDEAKAKTDVAEFKKVAQRQLRWTLEGLKKVLEVQALGNPDIASVDINKAGNSTFLDKLNQLGLNKQLQIPSN